MSKKILIIGTCEHNIDTVLYNAEVLNNGNDVKIEFSKSGIWNESCKGEILGHLNDDGDNINITMGLNKIILDYSEINYLRHLLNLKFQNDENLNEPVKYVEDINELK